MRHYAPFYLMVMVFVRFLCKVTGLIHPQIILIYTVAIGEYYLLAAGNLRPKNNPFKMVRCNYCSTITSLINYI